MKRATFLMMAFSVLASVVVGCSAPGIPAPSGTATEITDKIFAEAQLENFGMSQILATDDDLEYYLGSRDYPEFSDAVAVIPMINIDTRVLVIIRAASEGDVEAIKSQLNENIDPNKVVCVTFSLEDVSIESRGDVIFLTINTDAEQRAALVQAFQTVD
jgi:hypothetical protein